MELGTEESIFEHRVLRKESESESARPRCSDTTRCNLFTTQFIVTNSCTKGFQMAYIQSGNKYTGANTARMHTHARKHSTTHFRINTTFCRPDVLLTKILWLILHANNFIQYISTDQYVIIQTYIKSPICNEWASAPSSSITVFWQRLGE